MINPHHLELFYYVAKAGGISRACSIAPYGIQQPAISAQIQKLEAALGLSLFQRKPFLLTPAGNRLFGEVAPFFEKLGELGPLLREEFSQRLRIVAPGAVLKEHMPDLLQALKRKFPNLKAHLYERSQQEAISLIERGEADLAVTVRETALPPHFSSRDLIRLPLVLLLSPAHSKVRNAADFWTGKTPTPLIALSTNEPLVKQFSAELVRRGGNWPTAIETSSVELVAQYVAHGMGVGLSVRIPKGKLPSGVRMMPLADFPEIVIAAFWRGELRDPCDAFLALLVERARRLNAA